MTLFQRKSDVVSTVKSEVVSTLKSEVVSILCLDVETTLKMCCFLHGEINNIVSSLEISYSTSRHKINVKTTLKERSVVAGKTLTQQIDVKIA